MDAILTAMRSHTSVAAVQEMGCLALVRLSLNAENKVPAAEVEAEDWEGKTFFIFEGSGTISHFSTSCAQKAEVVIALGASIMEMRRGSEAPCKKMA